MDKVPVSEIFYSIQGEGILVGVPQIFVRFSGCNLKGCAFCDESAVYNSSMTVEEIISDIIKKSERKTKPHSVSLTGGEPLLYPQFLKRLCLGLKREGFLVYLESNGTLPQNLKKIKRYLDFISADIKLPSSTGLKNYFKEHKEFIKSAPSKKIFVKVVITDRTAFSCFKKAVSLVKGINKKIPFVIQPVTKISGIKEAGEEKILLFCAYALKFLEDVRIIAQMHKKLGVR